MEDKDKEQRNTDTEKQQSDREGIGCCCCCLHWREEDQFVQDDSEVGPRWQSMDSLVVRL